MKLRDFINLVQKGLLLIGITVTSCSMMNPASAKHTKKIQHIARLAPVSALYGTDQLADELNTTLRANNNNASIGVYVKSMRTGATLYSRNINQPMTPASTLKILTAEAALLYLSPDYRFSTQLLTDAKSVQNGILQGNLYIVLSGDPSLTYDDLVDLMMTLKSRQIVGISGSVYIDNTAYDESFYGPGWDWKDKNYCYAAPISASIINHNCLPFRMTTPKDSRLSPLSVIKGLYPITSPMDSQSDLVHCGIKMSKNSNITIDGCMTRAQSEWGMNYVVTDIPDYNRAMFKSILSKLNIKVYGSMTFGTAPAKLAAIGTHSSKQLRDLINDMLKKSDNVIAGALFKKIGQLYTHRPGSWENGSMAVSQILSQRANVNISGMRILDGSGLSASNLATPAQLMQVLNFAFHHEGTSYEFVSSLPIAGVDGTLKHRMWNIARKVRAKTGTISGVVSLAGYTIGVDKEPLAFVIMVNGNKGMTWRYRALEDKLVTSLTRYKA